MTSDLSSSPLFCEPLAPFESHHEQHVLFGGGVLARLGGMVQPVGRRAFLVMDPGVASTEILQRALASLAAAEVSAEVFTEVQPNPTEACVQRGLEAAPRDSDVIIAVGGGSAMDCAKGINFLMTNGGRMADYQGFGKASRPMLPSIGVPTTAGTGSEAQSYALISDAKTHTKMACGDPKARFGRVLLDPSLIATVPPEVRAATAMDALSHAVESYVCRRRNPVSMRFSREAFRRLNQGLKKSTRGAGEMLLGAYLAGLAIEHSMLGCAHAAANPLTASYGIVHGEAVGLMLPAVVRFNSSIVEGLYDELLQSAGGNEAGGGEGLAIHLESVRAALGLPFRLRDLEVRRDDLPRLAEVALGQWTAGFNPRQATLADFLRLYESAW